MKPFVPPSSNSSPHGYLSVGLRLCMMSFIDFAAQPWPLIFQSDADVDPVIRINDQVRKTVMHGAWLLLNFQWGGRGYR